MKTRFALISSSTPNRLKGCALFLLLLAFIAPRLDRAQNITNSSNPIQPDPTPPRIPSISKEPLGKTAAEKSKPGAITDVRIAPENGKLVVTVLTDRFIAPNEFKIDNPPRLVLDFHNAENRVQFSRLPVNAASVKRLRVQQFQTLPHMIARVVFDMEKDFVSHEITMDKTFVRIVFHPEPPISRADQIGQDPKPVADWVEFSPIPKDPSAHGTGAFSRPEPSKTVSTTETRPPHLTDPSPKVPMPAIDHAAVQPIRVFPRTGLSQTSMELPAKESPAQAPLPPLKCRYL